MIRFFRKIRQRLLNEYRPSGKTGRLSKYLIYAIGEIILVVIGILIALQINTWNDKRIQNERVKSYAQKLIIDLTEDIKNVEEIKYQAEASYLRLDSLCNYARILTIEDYNNLDIFLLVHNARYKPFSWNRGSFEEVKSSGILNFFENDTIVNLLVKYEADTKHMDLDYEDDRELIHQSTKLMSKVINYNYKSDQLTFNVKTPEYIKPVEIIDYQKEDYYIEMEKQSLQLVERDKKKFEEAINAYIDLQFNYRLRYDIELPRLINDAKTIIKLLEKNYLAEDISNGVIRRYPTKELSKLLTEGKEIDHIISMIKSNDTFLNNYDITEYGINRFGYTVMYKNQNNEALKIFKLNTELYPASSNTFYGYGECLMKISDKKSAIRAYEKALELNPGHRKAVRQLSILKE